MMALEGFVYIMSSTSRCLYVGVTRDIARRWSEHRGGTGSAFVARYHVTHLVHVERYDRLVDALRREKQLKHWQRARKLALIREHNPEFQDLARKWGWY